jgi:hypothetical protein
VELVGKELVIDFSEQNLQTQKGVDVDPDPESLLD